MPADAFEEAPETGNTTRKLRADLPPLQLTTCQQLHHAGPSYSVSLIVSVTEALLQPCLLALLTDLIADGLVCNC
jgi:hypothetical protein